MEKMLDFIKENKFNLALLFVYLLVLMCVAPTHEIWRDEAQVWCIVRDLNFFNVLEVARNEGHPFLWYLLIMPFAKMGFSVESMQILGALLVFLSVIFVVFKSPFDIFTKTTIVFSAGMIYYLPVIVRNYALIPLLIFLLAYLYNKKTEKPVIYSILIIFLSHTHLYMLGFCFALSVIFLFDLWNSNRKILFVPLLMCLLNFLIIVLLFNNTQNENYALENGIKTSLSIQALFVLIPQVLLYNIAKFSSFVMKNFLVLSVFAFYPAFLVFLCILLKRYKKVAFIFIFSIGFILFVFSQVYFNGILYQKIFLIYLIMIFCLWVQKNKDSLLKYSFLFLFLINMFISPIVLYEEFYCNFSGGKQIANYIKTNLNEEKEFVVVGNPFLFSSISAYLPNKKLYSILLEDYITFSTYKIQTQKNKQPFPGWVRYNITTENMDLTSNPNFDFIFASDNKNLSSKTEREIFKIFKLNLQSVTKES